MGRKQNTKINRLAVSPDALLAVAETVATRLAEKQEELGLGSETEALLRASISAAKTRSDRSLQQLRWRVSRSISQLCRIRS